MPTQRIIHTAPFLHQKLHKCTNFLRVFPWQSALATGEPDDDIAKALFLTRPHLNILRNIVAFVQQPKCRHPFCKGCANAGVNNFCWLIAWFACHFFGNFIAGGRLCLIFFRTAGQHQPRRHKHRPTGKGCQTLHLQASGFHAS